LARRHGERRVGNAEIAERSESNWENPSRMRVSAGGRIWTEAGRACGRFVSANSISKKRRPMIRSRAA